MIKLFEKYKENPQVIELTNHNLEIKESGYYIINQNEEYKKSITIKENIEVIIEENIKYQNESILNIETNAKVEYYHFITKDVLLNKRVNNKGKLDIFYVDLADESKVINRIELTKYNARLNFNSIIYGDKKNEKSYTLEVNHKEKNTTSNFNNYGVLDDEAFINMNVASRILKTMKKSNAHQSSKVISLSDKARANLNPILYIDEFDVMGGHGASFGVISKMELYYMMSRGITLTESKQILTISNLVAEVPSYMNEKIISLLKERMNHEKL